MRPFSPALRGGNIRRRCKAACSARHAVWGTAGRGGPLFCAPAHALSASSLWRDGVHRYLKLNKSPLWNSSSDQPIGHFLVPPTIPVNHANQCHNSFSEVHTKKSVHHYPWKHGYINSNKPTADRTKAIHRRLELSCNLYLLLLFVGQNRASKSHLHITLRISRFLQFFNK